jgi:dihydroorotate dehydrogenase electron transfer subunit
MDVQTARILFNRRERPAMHRLGFAWDALDRGMRAARFVMLAHPDRSRHLLPRPFSISDAWRGEDGTVVSEILYRPVGRFTRILASLREGEELQVGGLCGNGFPDPPPDRRPVLLAGGIGNAPFAYQVRELLAGPRGADPGSIHLFLGGRDAEEIYIQDVARAAGITIVEVTDDGSRGEAGLVTEALQRRLADLGPVAAFACGPPPMLRSVQAMALEHGFPCYLSVEERMACGYGVCNACVIPQRIEGPPSDAEGYLKACTDGPVFEAREIQA